MTYLHIPGHGFWYAVTDDYSRDLLAYHFTTSYSAPEVARAEAERIHGPLTKTPFLVTNNGSSFLARHFCRHIEGQYAQCYLQVNGYEGYNAVGGQPGITLVGCMAHARRKFDEALKAARENPSTRSDESRQRPAGAAVYPSPL